MATNKFDDGGGGGSGGSAFPNRGVPHGFQGKGGNSLPFGIAASGLEFYPEYIPNQIQLNKERKLVRHANFCGLEDVFEIHGKNREVHVNGYILESELPSFADVLDWSQEAEIVTPGWSGRVRVVKGEHEGPVAWDAREEQYLWNYSLDVVSTGIDEAQHISRYNDGIVSGGGTLSSDKKLFAAAEDM